MKTISLHVGDKLRVLQTSPFGAYLWEDQIVTIVGFNQGNSAYNPNAPGPCPYVRAFDGEQWYTDLRLLFKYYKKETK